MNNRKIKKVVDNVLGIAYTKEVAKTGQVFPR